MKKQYYPLVILELYYTQKIKNNTTSNVFKHERRYIHSNQKNEISIRGRQATNIKYLNMTIYYSTKKKEKEGNSVKV